MQDEKLTVKDRLYVEVPERELRIVRLKTE